MFAPKQSLNFILFFYVSAKPKLKWIIKSLWQLSVTCIEVPLKFVLIILIFFFYVTATFYKYVLNWDHEDSECWQHNRFEVGQPKIIVFIPDLL